MTKKVIIGKFGKTFGVRGWIKVHSFTNPTENILNFSPWFISTNDRDTDKDDNWQKISDYKCQQKNHNIIIQLPEINSPEQAQFYTNQFIAIEYTQLPAPQQNEFYWTDLVGCLVINTKNIELGIVDYLFATASNDVMVVKSSDHSPTSREYFIPFLKDVIINVDLIAKKITVDWDENF